MKSYVFRQSDPRELPASLGGEEVPVSRTNVRSRGHARPAAEDELVAHELGVVFTKRPRCRPRAWIGGVRAGSPLPDVAETLSNSCAVRRCLRMEITAFEEVAIRLGIASGRFPFGLGRKTGARPPREGVGFIVAHVANWFGFAHPPEAAQRV